MNCHRCDIRTEEPALLQLSRWAIFLCESCFRDAREHLDDCARRAGTFDYRQCGWGRSKDCPCVLCAEARILTPIPAPGLCQACERPIHSTVHLCPDCRRELDAWIDETDKKLDSLEVNP